VKKMKMKLQVDLQRCESQKQSYNNVNEAIDSFWNEVALQVELQPR
jgi:hypothetical protein